MYKWSYIKVLYSKGLIYNVILNYFPDYSNTPDVFYTQGLLFTFTV